MHCTECNTKIPNERYHMGYTTCVHCSTEEKVSCHTIYPHKTGAFIQVISKEQSENLNRLDRRGYSGVKKARNYKSIIKQKSKDLDKTAKVVRNRFSSVNNINHLDYDNALNQVMNYFNEWGYEPTLKYLHELNRSGDIPLTTRIKLQDVITERYLKPTPRALQRQFS